MKYFRTKTAMVVFIILVLVGNFVWLPYMGEQPSTFATVMTLLCVGLLAMRIKMDNNNK